MNISKIQILGPFNSGTNLISQILKQNIKQIRIHGEGHTLFWKHAINKSLIEKHIKLNKETLFICMYKPIHNWICSMRKSSYSVEWDKSLTGKCKFTVYDYKDLRHPRTLEYKNIIEIYNDYYNMYIELINSYKRVIFMNYYDIIDKNNVINYIKNKLFAYNLYIKNDHNIFCILDKPSKDHGRSVKSSQEAVNKRKTSYNSFSEEENELIKLQLAIKEQFTDEEDNNNTMKR